MSGPWLADVTRFRSSVILAALLLPLAGAALLATVRARIDPAVSVLVLVLLVVIVAATGLRLAGVIAALSSGLWYDLFLVEPYGRLTIAEPNQVEVTVLLVLVGAAVTEVALWGRRQAAVSSRRAGYLTGVLRTAELVTQTPSNIDALADSLCSSLTEILGVDSCRFMSGPPHDTRYAVLHHDGAVTRDGRLVDVGRRGLPSDEYTALLLVHQGQVRGHVLITASTRAARPSLEQRQVAVLLGDQLAPALTG